MKIIAYLNAIPANNSKSEKPKMLRDFIEGVKKLGDNGIVSEIGGPFPCDVAVLQGFVHEQSKNLPHLKLRKEVLEFQKQNKKRTIIIDSNLFLYRETSTKFFRFSYDGVFPNTGEYCNNSSTNERFNYIKNFIDLDLKPWKINQGRYILVCLQREGGWSMGGLSIKTWLIDIIQKIKQYSNRPILVRPHPGDKQSLFIAESVKEIGFTVSSAPNLYNDLMYANSLVVYNSSPAVAGVIEGIPTFIMDPDRSQVKNVSHHSLEFLENAREFERTQWIYDLCQCHWSFDDMQAGRVWEHMKKYAII